MNRNVTMSSVAERLGVPINRAYKVMQAAKLRMTKLGGLTVVYQDEFEWWLRHVCEGKVHKHVICHAFG